MSLSAGMRLGPYEVVSPLGAGGMGEVYRARDERLGRQVAIKVLPSGSSADPDRLRRFEQEARAAGALNHPNLLAVYDIGRHEGAPYLVFELLEGATLRQHLGAGPLPVGKTVDYASQIANGLAAAHEKGIIHRDLKPENLFVTRDGRVKILDFGLAKLGPVLDPDGVRTEGPTASQITAGGVVLGSAGYMSPEQAGGKRADHRTDIFALGSVLYEMLSGKRAFRGATAVEAMTAILRDEPPSLSRLRPEVPPALDRLVRTCLAKDPAERWQSAGDLARELKWTATGSAEGASPLPAPAGRGNSRERIAWSIAAAAILVAAVAALLPRRAPAPAELMRFMIMPPSGQHFFSLFQLSPDARRLLFLLQDEGGQTSIAMRSLDSLEMRPLAGTGDARGMFWSPDGDEIAFFSEGRLKRISAEGGPVRTICESGASFFGAWSGQGTILLAGEFGTPVVAVPASGGTPRPVTVLDAAHGEAAHLLPAFLPDGRHFVFLARNLDLEKSAVMLASLDSREVRRLFYADSSAVFADPGYFLFARDNAVLAWRFDPRGLKLLGDPIPALDQVHLLSADDLLGVSAAGDRLAYLSWSLRRRLVWMDRKGRELGTLGDTAGYMDVRISPGGQRVAVARHDPSHGQNLDVWVLDASRGTGSRITSERADEFNPAWSPDGERLVYVSERFGFYDLFERPAVGGNEKVLLRTNEDKVLPTVAPDGRHLLASVSEGGDFARVLFSLSGPGEAARLGPDSRFSEEHPDMSPDGRWSAFDSRESGRREVYVQPLAGGPKRQASIGGGQMPVWNRNGSELFYAAPDGMLMSVALRPAPGGLRIGEPQPLFPLQADSSGELSFHVHPYDVSADGQRFLVIRRAPGAEPDGIVVVTNWTALLHQSLPDPRLDRSPHRP